MLGESKISSFQFILLVMFFTIGSSILIIPSILVTEAKQDAWISSILGVGVGLLLVLLYCLLGERFPNKTIIEYSEIILGKFLGKIVSLLLVLFFLFVTSLVLINLGDFLITSIMSETPTISIYILYSFLILMGTRLGIETIARSGEILFWLFIFLFSIFAITVSFEIEFRNIQPMFTQGIKPLIRSTIQFEHNPFLQLIIFLMIVPCLNTTKVKKPYLIGTLLGGIILTIITFLAILVLGSENVSRSIFPSYELAKKINVGNFITRIESIMAFMWLITLFFKLVICFYATSLGIAQIFQLKDYRILTFPLAIIMIVLALIISPNMNVLAVYSKNVGFLHNFIYGFLIPFFLLVTALLQHKFKAEKL
ncbi:GerAB/ArcD/ProY family transporter [Metabacillus fastidiosus]|uniref:GerAB/ArcD/ProY family transporter n=1 Tax=Metabacillus fastidiosus TaxID=1458 RepID=UPI003D2757F4